MNPVLDTRNRWSDPNRYSGVEAQTSFHHQRPAHPESATVGDRLPSPDGNHECTRLEEADLDNLLGRGRYSVAPSIEELERIVTRGRIGQEVFSLILFAVVAAFCAEHVVANRFYNDP